jgi:hypothetical protein
VLHNVTRRINAKSVHAVFQPKTQNILDLNVIFCHA